MVTGLNEMYLDNYKKTGAEFTFGTGRFIAPRTIEATLGDGTTRRLRGENVIIGTGILKCSATPALLEHKHAREEKEIKAKQERLKAKIEEQQHHKALRKAEAARRDFERITKAKAENEAEANEKKAKKKTAGSNKPKTKPQLEAEAKQKADEKAKKEAHQARTDAVAAQYGYGVDGNGKSVSDQKHFQ
jgi:hypothetical protein